MGKGIEWSCGSHGESSPEGVDAFGFPDALIRSNESGAVNECRGADDAIRGIARIACRQASGGRSDCGGDGQDGELPFHHRE